MTWVFRTVNVWKTYSIGNVKTHALRGISLRIKRGSYIAIIGPSGSGKSTLMHILGCLDTPTKGKVYVDGMDVSKLSDGKLAEIRRRKIGFVFQAYNLINTLNALENVMLPMRLDGVAKRIASKRAKELLERFGLGKRLYNKPNQLSGGEQQRVAIARALINNPSAVLADEPTGNLDSKTGKGVMDLLESLNKEMGKTLVIVTHDPTIASRANKRVYIRDGKIEKED
ncbi:MAG TPA: ABC transporter ATP-binding protein [Candidatus Aenigmarchaeota archaeon]|nr:MAG: macrolide ABC transporter ATP-binding protein [Candidatus Aenigmarchaeota archaeon]HDD46493.1 ABC transporter ATP-binding protein [Candidatus Aenigmarchaeota archaeon]